MAILVCSTVYGGCGFIGEGFRHVGEHHVFCPECNKDHVFQVTTENLNGLIAPPHRWYVADLLKTEKRMQMFFEIVTQLGYRAPTRKDLVPNAEMLMVDVHPFMQDSGRMAGRTTIRLDAMPVLGNDVYYHCILPAWNGQCFVPAEEFLASGFRMGPCANDCRRLVRITSS